MGTLTLSNLLGNTAFDALIKEEQNREITSVVASSKEVDANSIFACIGGHHTDGHLFAFEAYEKGCRVFVLDKNIPLPSDAILIKTDNVKRTAWELLSKLYNYPQNKMTFIGVTGTKGKTTVVSFISTILSKLGVSYASVGTLGISQNGWYQKSENTTPDFFFLFPFFDKWAKEKVRFVILEMSSQSLADERLSYLPIAVGIFTCIGMDHVGAFEHADFRAYYRAKQKLFTDYPLRFAVVNDDDIYADTVTNTGLSRFTISLLHPADYNAEIIRMSAEGMTYRYNNDDYFLSLPGDFQLYNAMLSAVCVSRLLEIPVTSLLPLLTDANVEGRFERYSLDGKEIIVDYAHNATSVFALCSLCRKIFHGRLVAVFGSVGGRGKNRRFDLAKMGERMCDFCVLTSDNPDGENPYRILADMYGAFADKTKAKTVKDRREAVKYAVSLAQSRDVVLLLGKGSESFQIEGGKRVPYSESEALFSAVYS